MAQLTGTPPVVLYYLSEGNSKEDLIEWIWSLLSDEEKSDILKEACQQEEQ